MQDNESPYSRWLGIPADRLPPNYYVLLGIDEFEVDEDVIEKAAKAKFRELHTLAATVGPLRQEVEKLIGDVVKARKTLCNPDAKHEYDVSIRKESPADSSKPSKTKTPEPKPRKPPPTVKPIEQQAKPVPKPVVRASKPKPKQKKPAAKPQKPAAKQQTPFEISPAPDPKVKQKPASPLIDTGSEDASSTRTSSRRTDSRKQKKGVPAWMFIAAAVSLVGGAIFAAAMFAGGEPEKVADSKTNAKAQSPKNQAQPLKNDVRPNLPNQKVTGQNKPKLENPLPNSLDANGRKQAMPSTANNLETPNSIESETPQPDSRAPAPSQETRNIPEYSNDNFTDSDQALLGDWEYTLVRGRSPQDHYDNMFKVSDGQFITNDGLAQPFKLNASTSPKQINVMIADGKVIVPGIYKVEDGQLSIKLGRLRAPRVPGGLAIAGQRPTSFDKSSGLMVAKRLPTMQMPLVRVKVPDDIARVVYGPVAISANGKVAVLAVNDNLAIWDIEKNELLDSLHCADVQNIVISPDGRYIAFERSVLKVWDRQSNRFAEIPASSSAFGFSPDGKFLIAGDISSNPIICSTNDWKVVKKLPENVVGIAVSTSGVVAFKTASNKFVVRDIKTWAVIKELEAEPSPNTAFGRYGFTISPDGKHIFDSRKLYDLESGEVSTIDAENVAFIPGTSHVAVPKDIGSITVWDYANKKEVSTRSIPSGPTEYVDEKVGKLTISADGQYLGCVNNLGAMVLPWSAKRDYKPKVPQLDDRQLDALALCCNFRDGLERTNMFRGFAPSRDDLKDKDGKPILSWRVQWLGGWDDSVFRRFNRELPWNSARNQPLAAWSMMPESFRAPIRTNCVWQFIQGPGLTNSKNKDDDKNVGFKNDQIALVHAPLQKDLPWTAPQDFQIDIRNPWKGLPRDGFYAVFYSGKVAFIAGDTPDDELRKMFKASKGNLPSHNYIESVYQRFFFPTDDKPLLVGNAQSDIVPDDGWGIDGPKWNGTKMAATKTHEENAVEMESMTNSVGIKLISIKAGKYTMGWELEKLPEQALSFTPPHEVTISTDFHIGATEVTQAQWLAIMKTHPWRKSNRARDTPEGDNMPAAGMSINDMLVFCERLSEKEGKHYRLPYEGEWEYACRAGTKTYYSFGSVNASPEEHMWTQGNTETYREVATRKPNRWGLYDMHGNLAEVCMDYTGFGAYRDKTPDEVDPRGGFWDSNRVMRGGCWARDAIEAGSPIRLKYLSADQNCHVGFRVVLTPKPHRSNEVVKLTEQELWAMNEKAEPLKDLIDRTIEVTGRLTGIRSHLVTQRSEPRRPDRRPAMLVLGSKQNSALSFGMPSRIDESKLSWGAYVVVQGKLENKNGFGLEFRDCKFISASGKGFSTLTPKIAQAALKDGGKSVSKTMFKMTIAEEKSDDFLRLFRTTDGIPIVYRTGGLDAVKKPKLGEQITVVCQLRIRKGKLEFEQVASIAEMFLGDNQ